jgi:hypothetical protein
VSQPHQSYLNHTSNPVQIRVKPAPKEMHVSKTDAKVTSIPQQIHDTSMSTTRQNRRQSNIKHMPNPDPLMCCVHGVKSQMQAF